MPWKRECATSGASASRAAYTRLSRATKPLGRPRSIGWNSANGSVRLSWKTLPGLSRNDPLNHAVADVGPFIHLAETGCLDLLSIVGYLHVPREVWSETVGRFRFDADQPLNSGAIERHELPALEMTRFVVERHGLGGLHAREIEGLCLFRKLGIPILLTDGSAIREAARRLLSVTPVGSQFRVDVQLSHQAGGGRLSA